MAKREQKTKTGQHGEHLGHQLRDTLAGVKDTTGRVDPATKPRSTSAVASRSSRFSKYYRACVLCSFVSIPEHVYAIQPLTTSLQNPTTPAACDRPMLQTYIISDELLPVLCTVSLAYLATIKGSYTQLERVLRSGGILTLLRLVHETKTPLYQRWYRQQQKQRPR